MPAVFFFLAVGFRCAEGLESDAVAGVDREDGSGTFAPSFFLQRAALVSVEIYPTGIYKALQDNASLPRKQGYLPRMVHPALSRRLCERYSKSC